MCFVAEDQPSVLLPSWDGVSSPSPSANSLPLFLASQHDLVGFLKPWSDALCPFLSCNPAAVGYDSLVLGIDGIDVKFPADNQQDQIRTMREAIELLGRALYVDTSLWSAIPMKQQTLDRGQRTYVDPRQFRDEGLHPRFVFVLESNSTDLKAFEGWLNAVSAILTIQDPRKSKGFDAAVAELDRVDVFKAAQPGVYHVPVSLRVKLWDVPFANAFMARAMASSTSLSPALHLTYLEVGVSLLDSTVAKSLLSQLDNQGVVLRTVSAAEVGAVAGIAGVRSLKLRSPHGSPIVDKLCAALAQGVPEISATFFPSERPDWLLLLRAASLCSTLCHLHVCLPNLSPQSASARRSVEELNTAARVAKEQSIVSVEVNNDTQDGTQLLKTLAERSIADTTTTYPALLGRDRAILVLPDGDSVIAPRSSVVATRVPIVQTAGRHDGDDLQATRQVSVDFSIGLCSPEALCALVKLLDTCFSSRLTSLSFSVVKGAVFTQDVLASILAACPALLSLKLSHTELTTLDVLLDGYRAGTCRIEVLSIDGGHVGFIPFIDALGTRESVVAKTLRELSIGFPHGENSHEEAYTRAVEAMLEQNASLQFLELRFSERGVSHVSTAMSKLIDRVATKLRRFHGTPLGIACSLSIHPQTNEAGVHWDVHVKLIDRLFSNGVARWCSRG